MDPTPARTSDLERSARFWGHLIWISALGVVLPPAIGLMGTIFGMVGTFDELANAEAADPRVLAEGVSTAMWTTVGGIVVALVALVVFFVSLAMFISRRRALPGGR